MRIKIPNIKCAHTCKHYDFSYQSDGRGNEVKIAKCKLTDKGIENTGFVCAPDWCPLYIVLEESIATLMKKEGML